MLVKLLMNYLKASKLNLEFNKPLKKYTTFDIGGPVDVLARPKNIQELEFLIKAISKAEENFFVLGCGSNLLINDEGFRGVAIKLGQEDFLRMKYEAGNLEVGAGQRFPAVLAYCEKMGLGGLEFMAGIPASVGGAVKQNAGGRHGVISEVVESVTYINKEGKTLCVPVKGLDFSYRRLNLELFAISKVVLKVEKREPEKVIFFDSKRKTQPLGEKSAGCIFKNPKYGSAGILIETLGLKGRCFGGARVSTKHGNFIINENNAVFSDVLSLMELIRTEVKLKKNILLEAEINILQ